MPVFSLNFVKEQLAIKAAIFDIDGTLVDSVDLHARAWQEAFRKYGHDIAFEAVRQQIGKGGAQLVIFLTPRCAPLATSKSTMIVPKYSRITTYLH